MFSTRQRTRTSRYRVYHGRGASSGTSRVPSLLRVEEQSRPRRHSPPLPSFLIGVKTKDKVKAKFVDVKFVRAKVHFNSVTFQQASLSVHRSHHHGFFQLSLQQSDIYFDTTFNFVSRMPVRPRTLFVNKHQPYHCRTALTSAPVFSSALALMPTPTTFLPEPQSSPMLLNPKFFITPSPTLSTIHKKSVDSYLYSVTPVSTRMA
jgi:hypothetical protein